jgi:hypothetical protein
MTIGMTVEGKRSAGAAAMTLADLRQFVAELDQADAASDTPIEASVTWGGQLKSVKATAVRPAGE